MAALFSTGLRNKMLDTSSLKAAFTNGLIHVYSSAIGDIPTTADAAIDPTKHTASSSRFPVFQSRKSKEAAANLTTDLWSTSGATSWMGSSFIHSMCCPVSG